MTTTAMTQSDTVILKNLQYNALINNKSTLLAITTHFHTNFAAASATDDLKYSINYAVVSRAFKDHESTHNSVNYPTVSALITTFADQVAFKQPCDDVRIIVSQKYDAFNTTQTFNIKRDVAVDAGTASITDLKLDAIIGIFTFERFQKQPVVLDITMDVELDRVNLHDIGVAVKDYVSVSNFKTVEALVLNVNKLVYKLAPVRVCDVSVLKTDIIDFCDVGVRTRQTAEDMAALGTEVVEFAETDVTTDRFVIPNINAETMIDVDGSIEKDVYIAFGSNLGHQLENIMQAINELNQHEQIKVVQSSSLYKSKPMYFKDQADFINGCLKIKTTLTPHALLSVLKRIEYESLARVKHFDNGPRSIDLDIILYENSIVNSVDLNIPHIRMIERSFVLVPLCELLPPDFVHPVTAEPIFDHLQQLMRQDPGFNDDVQESTDLVSLIPLPTVEPGVFRYIEYDLVHGKSPTQLMAILNVTPDSFSDGTGESGMHIDSVMEKVAEMVANDVDVIDVGGCSTRPNSVQATLDEELNRVIPVVRKIKETYGSSVVVSVDTYRADVAEAAIDAGADIINDISGGTFDDRMYDVISKSGVGYVVNHTRGDISTMATMSDYVTTSNEGIKVYDELTGTGDDVTIGEVSKEMAVLVSKMYARGVRRWQLILDPGLGFAKDVRENLSVIRDLPKLKRHRQFEVARREFISFENIPVLLGPSRKKFIGAITGRESARERVNGTSASITAGIGFGADIVRVHDFKEMKDVCLMGDAIYKNVVID